MNDMSMLLPLFMSMNGKNGGDAKNQSQPEMTEMLMKMMGNKDTSAFDPMMMMLMSMMNKKGDKPAPAKPAKPTGYGLAPVKGFCGNEILHFLKLSFDK